MLQVVADTIYNVPIKGMHPMMRQTQTQNKLSFNEIHHFVKDPISPN